MQLDLFRQLQTPHSKRELSDERLFWLDVPIEVRRKAYSRRWSLQVEPSGEVRLSCPKGASKKAVQLWLQEMEPWLKQQLKKVAVLKERFPAKNYLEGELFAFKGHDYRLEKKWTQGLKARFTADHKLLVEASVQHPLKDIKQAIYQCYGREAKADLPLRVSHWAEKMRLWPTRLSLRNQKTRWGSCSASGHVSINWRLIAAPEPTIDYVIIHELAHLRHPNHSKQFWSLVEAFCPAWRQERLWLRENQLAFEFLRPAK